MGTTVQQAVVSTRGVSLSDGGSEKKVCSVVVEGDYFVLVM